MKRVIDARFPKRRARAICSIPEEEEFEDDDFALTAPAAVTESHSSPSSVMADIMQVSASDMRECLEGALMAILPREERMKRAAAAATSPVEWSHVRKGLAAGPPGTEELFIGGDLQGFIRCAICWDYYGPPPVYTIAFDYVLVLGNPQLISAHSN